MVKREIQELNEAFQAIIEGIAVDIETGTQEGNNMAAAMFNKQYPTLVRGLTLLGLWITWHEEQWERDHGIK